MPAIIPLVTKITSIIEIIFFDIRDFNNNDKCRMHDNMNQTITIDNDENINVENNETNGIFNNGISTRMNVIPNNYNSSNICGNYRRR